MYFECGAVTISDLNHLIMVALRIQNNDRISISMEDLEKTLILSVRFIFNFVYCVFFFCFCKLITLKIVQ